MGELIRREVAANPVEFSGERLTGAASGQVEVEHYHRYLYARDFCRGRDVLDVAAGEGYGTALMAQVAASAVGIEIDQATVETARREFVRPNLRFEQGDARSLPLPDASIDVAVSFETLEHLAEQDVLVAELRRVLRPDGLLIISTPDRDIYSPPGVAPNPYHVLELTRQEFVALLDRHFAHVAVSAQRSLIGSVMLGPPSSAPLRSFERRSAALIEGSDGLSRAPYLVALSSNVALPAMPDSVFVHRSDLDTDMQVRIEAELGRRVAERATRDAEQATREAERLAALAVEESLARMKDAQSSAAAYKAETERLRAEEARLRRIATTAATKLDRAEHEAALAQQRHAEALAAAEGAAREAAERAKAEFGERDSRLAAEMTAHFEANRRGHELAMQLELIQASSAWRATWPIRSFGARFPRVARRMRQGAKVLWWTATLQLPSRYGQWRRHRLRVEAPMVVPVLAEPEVVEALPAPLPPPDPIRLPFSADPLVSVIIPTYGQVDATLACLRSIADHPPACAIEVIVIDDAYKGPEDLAQLQAVEGIQLQRNGTNLGYLRSCNQAAAGARGEFVHVLNNDTELRAGAIDALVDLLRARPDAGLAGSKLMFPDGTLQEAGGIIWDDASGWNYGRGEDPARPEFNYVREADYCTGASIMVRRSLWQALGGYDEAFLPAYYEDTDLAFRIRANGLKVLYEPRSEVVHHEGMTHGTDLTQGIKASQVVNQATMMERWGPVLRSEHFPSGTQPLRARDRAHGRTVILVIDHYVPEPDRDAGSRSAMGIITSLLDAGWVVKFWPHNRAYSPVYTVALERSGIEVIDHRWPGSLAAWMHQNGGQLDHLLAIRPDIAADVMQHVVRATDAVLSFYGVDLHFARMRRQAEVEGSDELHREASAMERLERRIWRNFDIVIYPSEDEVAKVRAMLPTIDARGIVPFWFEASEPRVAAPAERSILFVAGFAHPPNVDAALFLIEEVMPLVEADLGPVHVTLAGSNPTAAVRALAGRDVDVTGYVTDEELSALYSQHRAAVVPLRFGAGVKGKVVESLSRGLPLVTTSIGAEGIDGVTGVVPVHDDAAGIAAALLLLLTDDAAWVAQSAAQVAFARRFFSREAMGRSVLAAFQPPG